MAFSIDNSSWTNWSYFEKTKLHELTGDDGEKIVYFIVNDQLGNYAIDYDKIILDNSKTISKTIKNKYTEYLNNSKSILNKSYEYKK